MGKYERPLTWILLIGLLGYLFVDNFSKTECSIEEKKEIRVDIQFEDKNLNIDSMADTVFENIDKEGDVDTVIKIIYLLNMYGDDSLDLNGNRVSVIGQTENEE